MVHHLLSRPLPRLSALVLGLGLCILAVICQLMGTGPYLLLGSLLDIATLTVLQDSQVAALLFEDDSPPVTVNVQYLVFADVVIWGVYALLPMPEVLSGLVAFAGETIISILLVHYLDVYRGEMEGCEVAAGSGEKVEFVGGGGEENTEDAVGSNENKAALIWEEIGKPGEPWVQIEDALLGEKVSREV